MEKIIKEKVEKEMQELKSRMQKCYYSKLSLNEAEKYIKGLMRRAEKIDGRCQKYLEKAPPYKMQQFIGRGRWSVDELRGVLQKYVKKFSMVSQSS